jgi:hypothetical protein
VVDVFLKVPHPVLVAWEEKSLQPKAYPHLAEEAELE